VVEHRNGKDVARPLWTLAKVAVYDASISPQPAPDEVAEAVIGMCGYQGFRGVEVDVLLDAIATGIVNYASVKSEESDNKSIPWKVYSARIAVALDQFRKTAPNNAFLTRAAGKVASLADTATKDVLDPIERGGAGRQPDPEAVIRWRTGNPVPALQPFTEVKTLVLKPAPRK